MTHVVDNLTPHTARQRLVKPLTADGSLTLPEVATGFLAVARHDFAPAYTGHGR